MEIKKYLMKKKSVKGQEEMVGFGLIIIIVAIILIIFLGISFRGGQRESLESYEVESFIQSFLQYTSECEDYSGFVSVQKLIFRCGENEICLDGNNPCEVLNSTLETIINDSWMIGVDRPIKGNKLEIFFNTDHLLLIENGNVTVSSKGSSQDFFKGGNSVEIFFNVYY
jgi:hypothetical protein